MVIFHPTLIKIFCEMYDAYHALGGNGMITKMKHEIEELHLKKKEGNSHEKN